MTADRAEGVAVTRNVWKIFGEGAEDAMAAVCRTGSTRTGPPDAKWITVPASTAA